MIYTDGNILMADTKKELQFAAKQLMLSCMCYLDSPFPHYHLTNVALKNLQKHDIKQMSAADMLVRYRRKNAPLISAAC